MDTQGFILSVTNYPFFQKQTLDGITWHLIADSANKFLRFFIDGVDNRQIQLQVTRQLCCTTIYLLLMETGGDI